MNKYSAHWPCIEADTIRHKHYVLGESVASPGYVGYTSPALSAGFQSQNGGVEPDLQLLASGTLFHEQYEILRCLGAGGMGAVYEALQLSTRRRRALKTMLPSLLADPEMRARFKLEATITADIESEHIVEVFDAGFDAPTGLPFLVMECLRGENLASRLRQKGALPRHEVVTLLFQAGLALDRTHAAGIVHRDLKPENLFRTQRDDGSPRLKILDFGIAKLVAQSMNLATTRNLGTPLYMSPEQIRGDADIDGRADQYSLAQIAFTLLVGHPYWGSDAQSGSGLYGLLIKVAEGVKDPATLRAGERAGLLPAGFNEWFARGTHLEASQRFETAGDLVEQLATTLFVPKAVYAPQLTGTSTAPAAVESTVLEGATSARSQATPDDVPSTFNGLSGSSPKTRRAEHQQSTLPNDTLSRPRVVGALVLVMVCVAAAILWSRRPMLPANSAPPTAQGSALSASGLVTPRPTVDAVNDGDTTHDTPMDQARGEGGNSNNRDSDARSQSRGSDHPNSNRPTSSDQASPESASNRRPSVRLPAVRQPSSKQLPKRSQFAAPADNESYDPSDRR